MPLLLKAKPIIDDQLPRLAQKCKELTVKGLTPHLGIILVGNNPASEIYVQNKKRLCEKIGAKFTLINLPKNTKEEILLTELNKLNTNLEITGCFVQLPVPEQLKHIPLTDLINPDKDVDGFHSNTIKNIYLGNINQLIPCTPKGIITLIKKNNIAIEGKDITIIGRSHIVGKPLALIFEAMNATVTLCHSKTNDLKKHTKNADILIVATGVVNLITKEHLRDDKTQVIIDVGMNRHNENLVGDVNFSDVKDQVKAITPVPGGVGPMTVFSLLENLLFTTQNILNQNRK